MASDLAFNVFRLAYLLLLWVLVLGSVSVLRRDIFGTVITPRGKGRSVKGQKRRREEARSKPTQPTSLLITGGPLAGTTMRLGSADMIIGRSPTSTLVIDDDYASSRHARLHSQQGQWWIEDLGSTNGTFVDDERLARPRALNLGDNVRIGQTTLELVH